MTVLDRGISYIVKSALRVVWGEFRDLRPRIHAVRFLSEFIPLEVRGPIRVKLMRSMGCTVGEGTLVADMPKITGIQGQSAANLRIGRKCAIGVACEFEIVNTITIGDNVTIGHQVLLLTTTHELGPRNGRAGAPVANPVVIEDGVMIGARCVVLPGVTIGKGSIIEPCSVVNTNVPPDTRASGIPARQIGDLSS